VAVLVLAGMLRSRARHATWRDPDAFAEASAKDSPRSWRAQGTLADMLSRRGEYARAVDQYLRAIALAPEEQAWQARNSLAELYLRHGDAKLAVEQLRRSLDATPNKAPTWVFLIQSFAALHDYREAYEWADRALRYGGNVQVFGRLRAAADSALRAEASGTEHDPRGSAEGMHQPY
jgi:tetratricopeptide (TPR) repeat protein